MVLSWPSTSPGHIAPWSSGAAEHDLAGRPPGSFANFGLWSWAAASPWLPAAHAKSGAVAWKALWTPTYVQDQGGCFAWVLAGPQTLAKPLPLTFQR